MMTTKLILWYTFMLLLTIKNDKIYIFHKFIYRQKVWNLNITQKSRFTKSKPAFFVSTHTTNIKK